MFIRESVTNVHGSVLEDLVRDLDKRNTWAPLSRFWKWVGRGCRTRVDFVYLSTETIIPQYPWGVGSRNSPSYQNLQMLKSHSEFSISLGLHLRMQTITDHVQLTLEQHVFELPNPGILNSCLHICGPVQFKPVLLKGQLYILFHLYT